jgi:hypothetical protein
MANSFTPILNSGAQVSATSSNVQATLSNALSGSYVWVSNEGPNTAYVRIGSGAQTATTNDLPILIAETVKIRRDPAHTGFAAICRATQTATLNIVLGEGD